MRTHSYPFAALAAVALSAAAAPAADPVVVDLPERATVRSAVVTVGDVARVAGGDAVTRGQVAGLDLAEVKARDQTVTVTRRVIEFRLQLAGVEPGGVVVIGADRVTVAVVRRAVTADEVVAAARAELIRLLRGPPDTAAVELVQPVVVRLPEIPEAERVTISARPHAQAAVGPGRVQMDVTIFANGEKLLALPVYLEVKPAGRSADPGGPTPALPGYPGAAVMNPVVPAGGALPPLPAVGAGRPTPGEVLVRPRQRTKMVVRLGAVEVSAVGDAQQEGRLGQSILLQNVDSKKMVTGRVVGPATVEVDLGGAP
ncbi:MAG: flagellar basal body P-ring biosynthesis protein FlgA [Gemmataceae bacterium]|nr:flagellar basal body P-ring biosynthesis protein FlgA [Gemmataceae bacterium]